MVYPSLGVTFIAIQENVNTSKGTGLEMMPFYNIFNEGYAEQTSKKIKAVWKSKAENGERVSSTVPYGYKKSDNDPKQWVIDEPAAMVGKLSDERYARMSAAYESEQKELLAAAESDEQTVRDMERERIDLHQFLNAMRECTDLKELTPTLVNTLIKRIEVHNSSVDEDGVKHVPVDIHFTAVGIINIPDTEEILQIMEEIRTKPLRIA